VIAFATLSGPVPKLGVVAVALLAAGAILTSEERPRAWAMLGALLLAPALLLADIWSSPQLGVIHRHPAPAAVGAAVVLVALGGLAWQIARRPRLLAPLAVLALPFRVPVSVGGHTSNLLVPLYFVIGAACLAWIGPVLFGDRAGAGPAFAGPGEEAGRGRAERAPLRFEQILAGVLVLYGIQAIYSVGFAQALQNMVFFYAPFALLLARLRDLEWDRALLMRCLQATVALAVLFACIGFVEEATKTLLLNPKLIATNESHPYFTVNSVFFDPDIFGRYLALVMILLVAVLLSLGRARDQLVVTAVLAILWAGLVLTLSRSSLAALLLGLATLAASRWRLRPVLVAGAVLILAGAAALAISPTTFGLNQGLNNASSGRAGLVTGGLSMFGDRPVWGYGSGAFENEYQRQHRGACSTLCASHTIPVTVAAEQGVIGLIAYFALVISALVALLRGIRDDPARAAIAAAFLALVLHTLLYADFLEDPVTWTLLAIGGALASQEAARRYAAEREERRRRRSTAHA
jgi:O-antigen ligase